MPAKQTDWHDDTHQRMLALSMYFLENALFDLTYCVKYSYASNVYLGFSVRSLC